MEIAHSYGQLYDLVMFICRKPVCCSTGERVGRVQLQEKNTHCSTVPQVAGSSSQREQSQVWSHWYPAGKHLPSLHFKSPVIESIRIEGVVLGHSYMRGQLLVGSLSPRITVATSDCDIQIA